jgi:hypothetical protein
MPISLANPTKANTLSVTIPATTAGNCLVVLISSFNSTGTATVSGITLGGSADNFSQAEVANRVSTSFTDSIAWIDPNCAGGQTAIVISGTNLSVTSGNGGVTVLEVAGLPSAVLDKKSAGTGGGAGPADSGTTAATSAAAEFWAGNATGGGIAAAGGSWTDESPAGGGASTGYQITSATGTADYSAAVTGDWSALVITLKAGAAAAAFTAPHYPLRGRSSATRGHILPTPAIRAVPAPPTPAAFRAPHSPLRGPSSATRGRLSAARALAPFIPPTPALFRAPHYPLRGPSSATRGRTTRSVIPAPTPPVITGAPLIPGDKLKPWRKRAWPRVPMLAEADPYEPFRHAPPEPLPGDGAAGPAQPAGRRPRPAAGAGGAGYRGDQARGQGGRNRGSTRRPRHRGGRVLLAASQDQKEGEQMTEQTEPIAYDTAQPDLNAIYTDRGHILALLALHYSAYIAYSDRTNPEWPVLTLETPHGQMAWHIAPGDLYLFPHVRRADDAQAIVAYDGHTTEEKHARILTRVKSFPAMVNA